MNRTRRWCCAVAALVATVAVLAPGTAGAEDDPTYEASVTSSREAAADGSELPGMAALVLDDEPNIFQGQFCGGTLISPSHVLTAAHCISLDGSGRPAPIDVYVGDTDLSPPDTGQRLEIESNGQLIHPNYDPDGRQTFDIAVLRLPRPVTNIPPVILSVPGLEILNVPETEALVYGWGGTNVQGDSNTPNSFPPKLQTAVVPMVPDGDCSGFIRDFDGLSELCAGQGRDQNPRSDACFGDSGGPLVVDLGEGVKIQTGLVSRGPTCGLSPTAYTAVQAYRDFIEFAIGGPISSFPDINGDIHEASIERIFFYGIAEGRQDGTYNPGAAVSRGAMAKFVAVALDLPLPAQRTGRFIDTRDNLFEPFIDAVVTEGIVSGFPDGTYRPNAPVTRGQMAKFLALAFNPDLAPVQGSRFSDTAGDTFEGFINAIVDRSIASGFPDGTYRPGVAVNRAQMATFLVRSFLPFPGIEQPTN